MKKKSKIEKSNGDLQLQLNEKNGSLAEFEKLKLINCLLPLESELTEKNSLLAEFEKDNQALQLKLSYLSFGMMPTISEEVTV